MKILKKFTAILMICLTVTAAIPENTIGVTLTAEAHSGRTDRFGGHHDYKNNNQDLADAFGNDLMKYYNHFIEYGCNENRISK